MSIFQWSPNLPIVACVYEDEQVGFFRIKHDTKKWSYCDAIVDSNSGSKTNRSDDSSNDESIDESIDEKRLNLPNFKVIHLNWLNEGSTLYYVTNNGQIKFFDFNLTENQLRLTNALQVKDELTGCIEVYFEQHSNIYLSSKNGLIYLVNELTKKVNKIIQLKASILSIMYFKRKSRFVLISDDFVLHQYHVLNQNDQSNYVELSNVKLEVFNKSFNHIEKLVDKRKGKKGKLAASFKQDDLFILKIDENFGIIGVCIAGERVIRLFQIDSGHNLAVIAIESTDYQWSGVSCLLYDERSQLLLAGTSNNQFLIWKRNVYAAHEPAAKPGHHPIDDERVLATNQTEQYSKQFEFVKLAQFLFDGTINSVGVNKNEKIAIISNSLNICVIEKQILNFNFLNGLAIIQLNARDLKLIWLNSAHRDELIVNLGENVKDVFLNPSLNKLAIRTKRSTELNVIRLKDHKTYEIIKTLQLVQNFKLILQDDHVWQLNLDLNKSRTLTNNQGLSLNCYSLNEQDEQQIYPIDLDKSFKNERIQLSVLDCNHNHLLIIIQSEQLAQNYCYLVYELNRNEAIAKCRPTMILVDDQIVNAKINSNGTLIAIVDGSQIFLLECGSDELQPVKLSLQRVDQIHFSSNEPRLLCVQNGLNLFILICYIQLDRTKDSNPLNDKRINCQLYDKKQIDANCCLIGFEVPHIYVLNRDEKLQIIKESLNEFDEISIEAVRLIIDFLTDKKDLNLMIKKINKIDQKSEQNENLWLNLARSSVKCRNVEMGLYCMARLKNVRVIRDAQNELRSRSGTGETRNNLALAVLAMNVNLFQEAEELFKQSDNNLKLIQYYESRNDWSIALNSIEKLNERSVFYDYAKYNENELGDLENAAKYYELSCTNTFEVTRMLFDLNELSKLKSYCLTGTLQKSKGGKKDSESVKHRRLKQWWGQYNESIGDFQSSLKAYEQAKDYYNQTRLLCLIGNLDEAKRILNANEMNSSSFKNLDTQAADDAQQQERQSKNAAMLHLGKHLESIDPVESVQYFLNCGAINHAIKTCKTNQFDEQLTKIIENYGSKNEIVDLLKRLDENEDNYENLFNLYMKIDRIDKCLKIGFQGRLWSQLRSLLNGHLDKLYRGTDDDPADALAIADKSLENQVNKEWWKKIEISDATIELALEYLKSNSQIIDIVINILLIKGDHKNLIKDLILDYKIDINNELIDKVEKIFNETQGEANSKSLLQSLADSAMIQGTSLFLLESF